VDLVHAEHRDELAREGPEDAARVRRGQGREGQPPDGRERVGGRRLANGLRDLGSPSERERTLPAVSVRAPEGLRDGGEAPSWSPSLASGRMKAMVLAAGLGTRLKPITFEVPKPMVPVLDRPVMAHIVGLLERQGFDDLIANLHWFPEVVKGYFGDRLTYRHEEELLGTAGGVRNVRDFFGDDLVVVVSGDALTDLDLDALVERHRTTGGIATLTVKRVPDTREYGVVLHDRDGRVNGFQEKPAPAEALSDLGNCGIYCFSPQIFDYFPDRDCVDWAQDVFPALLEADVPFYIHEIDDYWNDVGSLDELRQGTWDALEGRLRLEAARGAEPPDHVEVVGGPIWIGEGCQLGEGVRLMGPVVIGDRVRVGDGASLRESIVFPGTDLEPGTILVGAITGRHGIVANLRPLEQVLDAGRPVGG
jgi:mannose-1-phosphate guanylyltransferase